jgi:hypothetical protein
VPSFDDLERAAGLASGSTQAGQGDRELFVIGAEGSILRRSHLIREVAIQTLGAAFQWLAIVPAAIGFVTVMELLGGRESSLVVGLLGEWSCGGADKGPPTPGPVRPADKGPPTPRADV